MENNRVQYIDVWRFFAVALVIVSHLVEFSHPFYGEKFPGLIWRIHPIGQLGVYIFFCISGYVICRGMLHETAAYGAISMRGFYVRRAFRILPPFLLYMSFLAVMAYAGVFDIRPVQFAQSAAFLCNIESLGDCGWYLGHTWSLAFEEQFYLVFPLLFAYAGLALHRGRMLFTLLLLVGTAVCAYFLSSRQLTHYLSIFSFMMWGCLCAVYQDRILPVLARMPLALWLAACMLLLAVNLVALPAVFFELVYPVAAPPLVCIAVFGTPLRHPLALKIFSDARLVYLGQMSYTVYLWQQAATKDHGFASPLVAILLVLLVFGFAHLSFKYFETPFIRLGRRISSRQLIATSEPSGHSTSAARVL